MSLQEDKVMQWDSGASTDNFAKTKFGVQATNMAIGASWSMFEHAARVICSPCFHSWRVYCSERGFCTTLQYRVVPFQPSKLSVVAFGNFGSLVMYSVSQVSGDARAFAQAMIFQMSGPKNKGFLIISLGDFGVFCHWKPIISIFAFVAENPLFQLLLQSTVRMFFVLFFGEAQFHKSIP